MRISGIYKCAVCALKAPRNSIVSHHERKHPNIPLRKDKIKYITSIEQQFQCNVCKIFCTTEFRSEHRKAEHPEPCTLGKLFTEVTYRNFVIDKYAHQTGDSDLGFVVSSTHRLTLEEVEEIERRWSNASKENELVECKLCQNQMDPNLFAAHFARQHWNKLQKLRKTRFIRPSDRIVTRAQRKLNESAGAEEYNGAESHEPNGIQLDEENERQLVAEGARKVKKKKRVKGKKKAKEREEEDDKEEEKKKKKTRSRRGGKKKKNKKSENSKDMTSKDSDNAVYCAPDENQSFYTICVSHSELQKLLLKDRIYSKEAQFFLKDSK